MGPQQGAGPRSDTVPWHMVRDKGRAPDPKQALTGLHLGTGERSFFELSKNVEVDAKCHRTAMTTNYTKMNVTARVI